MGWDGPTEVRIFVIGSAHVSIDRQSRIFNLDLASASTKILAADTLENMICIKRRKGHIARASLASVGVLCTGIVRYVSIVVFEDT